MDPFTLVIKMTMLSVRIVGFFLKITVQLITAIIGARSRSAPPVMPSAPTQVDPLAAADAAEAAFQAAEFERQLRAHQQSTGS